MNNLTIAMERIAPQDIRVAFVSKLSMNEPVGLAYLSAYLKNYLRSVNISFYDPQVNSIDEIKAFSPNLILYSLMTGQHKEYINRNIFLKNSLPPFISVFGGPHPTYFPEFIENQGVDIICQGEGEKPMLDLFSAIANNSEITKTPGLWVKENGNLHKNPVAHLTENLDELPFPDRDLYYTNSNFLRQYGRKPIVGARGCPFKCSYCYNSGLNELFRGKGKVLRRRSPASVVAEAAELKNKYNVKFVAFIEDVFCGADIAWLLEFEERYKRLNLPFFASLRAEFVKPEIAHHLKKSGCVSISMAIEHGDYEYRKKYLFRRMTDQMLIEGTHMLENEGIKVASPIMLGLPFTEIDDDLKSLDLVCKSKPSHATTAIFHPYPGTALTQMCLQEGILDEDGLDDLKDDFYKPANLKGIDYEAVLKLHNNFSILWFMSRWLGTNPRKWYRILPAFKIINLINVALKYFSFMKIIGYKRSLWESLTEIYQALATGVFGFKFKKKVAKW